VTHAANCASEHACASAFVQILTRRNAFVVYVEQIYEIEAKLVLDPTQVKPGKRDFAAAMRDLTPAAHRSVLHIHYYIYTTTITILLQYN
jgi:hypothetical protein